MLHKGLDVQVIEEARKQDCFDIVMGGLMYSQHPLLVDELSTILSTLNKHLTRPGILSVLRRCHSILSIAEDDPYHASLRDFLTDESRATSRLFLAPATCHGRLVVGCFSAIADSFRDASSVPSRYAFMSWHYHACSVLITSRGDDEGLGEMEGMVQEMIKAIDLKWVERLIIWAISWTTPGSMVMNLPPKKVQEWILT